MRSPITRIAAVAAALIVMSMPVILAVGTPAGTSITNQANVTYTDINGNPLSVASNVVSTIVSQVASVTVAPDAAASANPGDTVFYGHQVTNGGNGSDTINLTAVSGNGWATVLYADNNGDGAFDAGDTPLVDTDGDLVPDIGLLAADAVVNILAAVTVPPGTISGAVDAMVVTGTSAVNGAISDIATDTTTVQAPDVSVVKSVVPAGPQVPGATLTYTVVVTNNGTGDANGVQLVDSIPANTTYVGASITFNAAGMSDAADADAADHNITNAGAITVNVGTLTPTATATITFQVTIN
jgi:uncharacterized repeat protein (TIGR01451 family)